MNNDEPIPVTVRILDREYQVACREEERQPLLDSARYVDSKMKDIKGDRKVVGTDRIAVMAALNIAHEYLQCKNNRVSSPAAPSERLNNLQEKVEMALNRYKQTELAI
jgi:cell division protein ZapA